MIFTVIIYLNSIISSKILKIIKKIKLKYYILILTIFLLSTLLIWNIGLKATEPLVLFNSVNTKEEPTQDITNIKPNTQYKFEFDINSKTAYKTDNIYTIRICERNRYDDILVTHEIELGTFQGIKDIEFTTTPYTYKILLEFKTDNRVAQRGLIINSLKINEKIKPLKYKFLPTKLVDKIQDINLKTISVTERFEYMKDACKLISKYGILGIGADGWKDRQYEVQDYWNFANEPHSYILEIFCEFGIIGFIAVICIIIKILYKFIEIIKKKQYDISQISIILAVLVLFMHSCIDFELSFMYMLIILFTLIAIIEVENKEYKYLDVFMKIVVITFVSIAIYFNTKICIYTYVKNEENPYSVEYAYNNKSGEFSTYIDKIVERRKYVSHVDLFTKMLYENNLNENDIIKLYDIIKNEKNISRNDVYEKMNRIDFYKKVLIKLTDVSKYTECEQQILQEIIETKELLSEPEKCRLSLEDIEDCKENLEQIEKEVKETK